MSDAKPRDALMLSLQLAAVANYEVCANFRAAKSLRADGYG
jgi:hypothetical protein